MIKKIVGILLASLILLQALIIQAGNISRLVLCFGEDGHIALEAIIPIESNYKPFNCIHLIEFNSETTKHNLETSACHDLQLKTQLSDIIVKQLQKVKTNHLYTYYSTINFSEIANTLITEFIKKEYKTVTSILKIIRKVELQL